MAHKWKITYKDGNRQEVEADDHDAGDKWCWFWTHGPEGKTVLRVAADAVLSIAAAEVPDRSKPASARPTASARSVSTF